MTVFSAIKAFFINHIVSRIHARVVLVILSAVCVFSILFHYFTRDDSISIATVLGVIVVPFQEGANEVGSFLFRSDQNRLSLKEAKERVAELEEENLQLRMKLQDANDAVIENEELRALLRAKNRLSEYEMQEAKIIGSDGVNCFNRFTINKGTMDGVRVDMNVINADGLVGIVTSVGLNYAVVTAIIEDNTSVSAMTRHGHHNCIATGDLSGSGSGIMLLSNALADFDETKDNAIVTSSISDKHLPGLLLGYAENVVLNPDQLTKSGTIRTAVDFNRLQEVLVITTMKEKLQETEAEK